VAYAYERPDVKALEELEELARHMLDELSGWRRRCLTAEAELQELRSVGGGSGPDLVKARQRLVELETENKALRQRVDTARDRVRGLMGRLSFLEQGSDAT
jgi:FtsZ-binding cell division protein ZapB